MQLMSVLATLFAVVVVAPPGRLSSPPPQESFDSFLVLPQGTVILRKDEKVLSVLMSSLPGEALDLVTSQLEARGFSVHDIYGDPERRAFRRGPLVLFSRVDEDASSRKTKLILTLHHLRGDRPAPRSSEFGQY
jgi:hypothetical protein